MDEQGRMESPVSRLALECTEARKESAEGGGEKRQLFRKNGRNKKE